MPFWLRVLLVPIGAFFIFAASQLFILIDAFYLGGILLEKDIYCIPFYLGFICAMCFFCAGIAISNKQNGWKGFWVGGTVGALLEFISLGIFSIIFWFADKVIDWGIGGGFIAIFGAAISFFLSSLGGAWTGYIFLSEKNAPNGKSSWLTCFNIFLILDIIGTWGLLVSICIAEALKH